MIIKLQRCIFTNQYKSILDDEKGNQFLFTNYSLQKIHTEISLQIYQYDLFQTLLNAKSLFLVKAIIDLANNVGAKKVVPFVRFNDISVSLDLDVDIVFTTISYRVHLQSHTFRSSEIYIYINLAR